MKVRHLGTSELIDQPKVYESNYEFSFDGIEPIYSAIRINSNFMTADTAIIQYARMVELMLHDVEKERERLMSNV